MASGTRFVWIMAENSTLSCLFRKALDACVDHPVLLLTYSHLQQRSVTQYVNKSIQLALHEDFVCYSSQNLTVERVWREVNSRVNYPLKRILIAMEERQQINMTDATSKFCVSFVSCNVSSCGLSKFVAAWNHHSIPGEAK